MHADVPSPVLCYQPHWTAGTNTQHPQEEKHFLGAARCKKHQEILLQGKGRGCWKPTAADNWGAPCRQVGASHPPTAPAAPPAQHELRRWEPNHSGFVYAGRALLLAVLAPVLRVDVTYAREGIPLPAAPYFPRWHRWSQLKHSSVSTAVSARGVGFDCFFISMWGNIPQGLLKSHSRDPALGTVPAFSYRTHCRARKWRPEWHSPRPEQPIVHQEGLCLLRSTGKNWAAETSQLITCASGGWQLQPHSYNAEQREHCFAPHQGLTPARDGAGRLSHPGQNPGRAHGWCPCYTANSQHLCKPCCAWNFVKLHLHKHWAVTNEKSYFVNMNIQDTSPSPQWHKSRFYIHICMHMNYTYIDFVNFQF